MTDFESAALATGSVDPAPLAWEDPPRTAPAGTPPVLSVAGFEGPLDWLVELARARKIDLARLSIMALVGAFCDAMEAALPPSPGAEPPQAGQAATASTATPGPADLARWADWLVMAATLTQLRSQLLLPADAPEAQAAQSEAEALRRQIVRRAQMAVAADWLERRPQLGREVLGRGTPDAAHRAGRTTDVTDLLRACLVILRVPEEEARAFRPRAAPFWTVADAMGRMRAILGERSEGVELGSLLPRIERKTPRHELRCRAAVASTLVAGLELAREGIIRLDQRHAELPVLVSLAAG